VRPITHKSSWTKSVMDFIPPERKVAEVTARPLPADLCLRPDKLAGGPGFRRCASAITTFAFRSDKPTGEAASPKPKAAAPERHAAMTSATAPDGLAPSERKGRDNKTPSQYPTPPAGSSRWSERSRWTARSLLPDLRLRPGKLAGEAAGKCMGRMGPARRRHSLNSGVC
jgi:hypothetical protein